MQMALALAQAQQNQPKTNSGDAFRKRYYYAPDQFMLDCFDWPTGEGPTPYQLESARNLLIHKRVSERGPHGLGKTTTVAQLILWFALTRDGDDWKVPTTASAWRQLTFYLWPEIHKWSQRIKWDIIGRAPFNERTELKTLSLKLRTGEAFAAASNKPALLEGAHADHIFYVFDEAKTIPGATFDAAEGALSGDGEALAVAFSTPGPTEGRFYDIHSRKPGYEEWHLRHVTLEEAIAAKRVSLAWAEQRARQWGPSSAVFLNRVRGEFASSEADVCIPEQWVRVAMQRWRHTEIERLDIIAADIARAGENQTVLALRQGDYVAELRKYSLEDTMEIAGRIKGILDKYSTPNKPNFVRPRAVVDVVGVGAGVYDRLLEQGYDTSPFSAASYSTRYDKSGELGFVDRRSAAWWHMRELLDPQYFNSIALPPDDELLRELTTPLWKVTSGGKIRVESKDTIAKRLDGKSTDSADAVVMVFDDDADYIEQLDHGITRELVEFRGT